MASLDELKRTFFDECGELLQDMETGLTDLQDGSGSEDTVHAVFRAVHSIKGGAGIFGFEGLVEFAHVFETVLDSVRHAFVAGMDTMLWACAGIALASAILAVIFLPRRTDGGAVSTANAGVAGNVPDVNGVERAELEA